MEIKISIADYLIYSCFVFPKLQVNTYSNLNAPYKINFLLTSVAFYPHLSNRALKGRDLLMTTIFAILIFGSEEALMNNS